MVEKGDSAYMPMGVGNIAGLSVYYSVIGNAKPMDFDIFSPEKGELDHGRLRHHGGVLAAEDDPADEDGDGLRDGLGGEDREGGMGGIGAKV